MHFYAHRLPLFLPIVLLISLIPCYAKIILYDNTQTVIATINNVDLPWINGTSYGSLTGSMEVAKFTNSSDTEDCAIEMLTSPVDVLVIPFDIAMGIGCNSYSDIIKCNNWALGSDGSKNTSLDKGAIPSVFTSQVKQTKTSISVFTDANGALTTQIFTTVDTSIITGTTIVPQNTADAVITSPTTLVAGQSPTQIQTTLVAAPTQQTVTNSQQPTQITQQQQQQQQQASTSSALQPASPAATTAPATIATTAAPQQSTSSSQNGNLIAVSASLPIANVGIGLLRKRDNVRSDTFQIFTPRVIVLTSGNGGTPGVGEIYRGDLDILRKAVPGITLVSIQDMTVLEEDAPVVTQIEITAESGPWLTLISTPSWIAFAVIIGICYACVIFISLLFLCKVYTNLGYTPKNPKFWLYPGIAFVCTCAVLILELSPGDIFENRLPIFARGFISYFKNMLLNILFAVVEIPWKTAATNICRENLYHPNLARRLSIAYSYLLTICIFNFLLDFVIRMACFANPTNSWVSTFLKLAFIVDSFCLCVIALEFLAFGLLMTRALSKRVSMPLLSVKRRRTAMKISVMVVLLLITIIFFIIAGSLSFLPLTVQDFWVAQITQNSAIMMSSIIIILVLQDETIGRHLPTTALSVSSPTRSIRSPSLPENVTLQHDPNTMEMQSMENYDNQVPAILTTASSEAGSNNFENRLESGEERKGSIFSLLPARHSCAPSINGKDQNNSELGNDLHPVEL